MQTTQLSRERFCNISNEPSQGGHGLRVSNFFTFQTTHPASRTELTHLEPPALRTPKGFLVDLSNFRRIMDWLRASFQCSGSNTMKTDLPSVEVMGISALPAEMILCIATMLPPQSAACLALCNRRFSQLLGPVYWKSLLKENATMISFLRDLVKDLPNYWICFQCHRLHQLSRVPWPRSILEPPHKCMATGSSTAYYTPSQYRISFPYIQLAMMRQQYSSSHGLPLEAFQSTEIFSSKSTRSMQLLSVEARIASDEFLTRSQLWVLAPRDHCQLIATVDLLCQLCHHGWLSEIPSRIRSCLEDLKSQGRTHAHVQQCLKCHMDFEIEVLDFAERGLAIVLTRWHNLGKGLDPADAKWYSHGGSPWSNRPDGYVHVPHVLGSVRDAYENQEGISVEALIGKNTEKLFSKSGDMTGLPGADGFIWKRAARNSWFLVPSRPIFPGRLTSLWMS